MGRFDKTDPDYLFLRAYQKWGKWDRDVISLSVADIDYPPPREVQAAVEQWLHEERAPYGHHQGEPELRQALADKISTVNRIPASREDILVIPGTMFGIFLACYLCLKPGDEAILTPTPVYGPFWKNVIGAGATPVAHDLLMDGGFRYDSESLESLVTPRTKLLMVCNPHNPTGLVLAREELEAIAKVALRHDLMVFSDELYEDMIFEGEHISIGAMGNEIFQRCLTVFGFSKAFGIPGYRVAYLVVPPKWKEKVIDASRRIIVHTDVLAQAAAFGALEASGSWVEAFMEHLLKMRGRSLEVIREIPGVACNRPQATPFLFPDIRIFGLSSRDLTQYLLNAARVVVEPGTQFGPSGEGFIRINLATSWDVLEEAFRRMRRALGELHEGAERGTR
jgi:aspartate/methionine/tyrosine aminotransferase